MSVVREEASNEGTSRRPLFIHMLNNLSCEEPRVTIKREQAKAKGELSRDKYALFLIDTAPHGGALCSPWHTTQFIG